MVCEHKRVLSAHLIQQGVSGALLLHAQVTNTGHELVRVQEEARAQQEGEHIRPLMARRQNGLSDTENKGRRSRRDRGESCDLSSN